MKASFISVIILKTGSLKHNEVFRISPLGTPDQEHENGSTSLIFRRKGRRRETGDEQRQSRSTWAEKVLWEPVRSWRTSQ